MIVEKKQKRCMQNHWLNRRKRSIFIRYEGLICKYYITGYLDDGWEYLHKDGSWREIAHFGGGYYDTHEEAEEFYRKFVE
jgi:hypothetical protein